MFLATNTVAFAELLKAGADSWSGMRGTRMGASQGSKAKSLYVPANQLTLLSGNSRSRAAPQGKRRQEPEGRSHHCQEHFQAVPYPTAPKGGKQGRPKVTARSNKRSRS